MDQGGADGPPPGVDTHRLEGVPGVEVAGPDGDLACHPEVDDVPKLGVVPDPRYADEYEESLVTAYAIARMHRRDVPVPELGGVA